MSIHVRHGGYRVCWFVAWYSAPHITGGTRDTAADQRRSSPRMLVAKIVRQYWSESPQTNSASHLASFPPPQAIQRGHIFFAEWIFSAVNRSTAIDWLIRLFVKTTVTTFSAFSLFVIRRRYILLLRAAQPKGGPQSQQSRSHRKGFKSRYT